MIDVKDRVNKPRRLRGTPSYAFINKLSFGTCVVGGIIGLCMGYVYYQKEIKRPDFGKITLRDTYAERQEDRIRAHIETRRMIMEHKKEAERDEEFMLK